LSCIAKETRLKNLGRNKNGAIIFSISFIFTNLFLVSCAVNPVTGQNEFSLLSRQDEISIGNEQYGPSQQSQGGEYKVDPELSIYVNEVGQRLATIGRRDYDLPYEFVVLNNSVPNAWALPGGKIAVNRGLLIELNSEAELAAVLGHGQRKFITRCLNSRCHCQPR